MTVSTYTYEFPNHASIWNEHTGDMDVERCIKEAAKVQGGHVDVNRVISTNRLMKVRLTTTSAEILFKLAAGDASEFCKQTKQNS
jgi:hypothetical protein